MALTDAAKEAIFLRRLLSSLKFNITNSSTLIKTDSDSALKHVKNNINYLCTKYIKRRHHYLRETYDNGEIDIEHIPAAAQAADILTKPLNSLAHARAIQLLNLQAFSNLANR